MKKTCRVLFLLGLIAGSFIFSACEKDRGEIDYNNVSDDDWKKKNAVFVDNTGNGLSNVDFSVLK